MTGGCKHGYVQETCTACLEEIERDWLWRRISLLEDALRVCSKWARDHNLPLLATDDKDCCPRCVALAAIDNKPPSGGFLYDDQATAFCPQCGLLSGTDEDGCCPTCGADATGPGVDALLKWARDAQHFEDEWKSAAYARDNARDDLLYAEQTIKELRRQTACPHVDRESPPIGEIDGEPIIMRKLRWSK